MNKKLFIALFAAALFGAQFSGGAKAATYGLSLNPISGPESGTGSFTIITPPVGTSGILTQGNGLTAMNFTIDGLNFALNNWSEVTYAYQGSNLVLESIFYGGIIGNDMLLSISLGGAGAYSFTDNDPGGSRYDTVGTISVSQTPVPTTLPLLATGLFGLAMLGWWRKRDLGEKQARAIAA
jgi:hypothetical protein